MKRVVAIVILMAVVTSLFAFSVSAETDFGYSVSVSNQDSINGVVITLKANRGSIVNSGTAALGYSGYCPVLVSITVQNTNNQNVLINNLKFKLTTNSSGNFSRIVSFEQLSNDLIVAETPYDLNNYISIVPSNEYSFGTGIVVPANSSMYMVCIMNVYANYDTSTNQWQVPSLQYIGYDQNITVTAGNYNATGVPVDLSEVLVLLEDLIDTVSTSAEMQSLINVFTYSGSSYSVNLGSGSSIKIQKDNFGATGNRVVLDRILGQPYLIYSDTIVDTANDSALTNGSVRYPFYIRLANANNSGAALKSSYYYNVHYLFPAGNYGVNVTYYSSQIFNEFTVTTDGLLQLDTKFKTGQWDGYIPEGTYITTMIGYIDVPIGTTLTWGNPTLNYFFGTNPTKEDIYLPIDEYSILRDLYLSLVKDSVDDNTEEAQDMNDEIHDAEQVWYDNNSEALEQVGLSNYRFSTSQSNGITQAVTQFQAVWNALGDWTNVYIFILILSISTYIIRHEPTTRVKQYRSSVQAERAERISYYGRKNAESRATSSSGSTLKNAIRRRS